MASQSSRSNKAQLREQARATAKLLREQQERAERRRKITRRSLLGLGGLTVAGGVAAVVYLDKSSEPAPGAPGTGGASAEGIPAQAGADGSLSYGRDFMPGTSEPQAKLLEEYFDYSCSHCAVFDVVHADEVKKLVQDGTVTLVLHPVKILGQPWTDMAVNALGVVLANEPDKAYDFHKEVFALYAIAVQNKDASELTLEGVTKAAQQVGVSEETTGKFAQAIESNQFQAWTETGTKAFADKGFTGTPTIVYDGQVLDLAQISSPTGLTDHITGGAVPAGS